MTNINKRTRIVLTATPKIGYNFVRWSNGITENPYITTVGNIIGQENRIEPIYALEDSSVVPIGECAYNEIKYVSYQKLKLNYEEDLRFYTKIISHEFDEDILHSANPYRGRILFSEDVKYIPKHFFSNENSDIIQLKFPDCTQFIGEFYDNIRVNAIYAKNPNLIFVNATNLKNTNSSVTIFWPSEPPLIKTKCIFCNTNICETWKNTEIKALQSFIEYGSSHGYPYSNIEAARNAITNYDTSNWYIPVNPYVEDGIAYTDNTKTTEICQVDVSTTDMQEIQDLLLDEELRNNVSENIERYTTHGTVVYTYINENE